MQLSQIEIINLWDEENITLSFKNRVTFLTGINGSGKSTLLNIIYDTLDINAKKGLPATSKNRFWSAEATFKDGAVIQTAILPDTDEQKSIKEEITRLHQENPSLHNFKTLKKIECFYQQDEENKEIHHINYSGDIKGQFNIQTLSSEFEAYPPNKPLAFLFQEDRVSLHNIEKSNIDFSLNYWQLYKNSIDGRFAYLRDSLQISESHTNTIAQKLLKNILLKKISPESKEYKDWQDKIQSIEQVTSLLNTYFSDSGKKLTKDEDNKITLKWISNSEKISWHLLSRGEKTLIYLFFAVFLYKDKVSVFLFDEPEISLHVKWQHTLIKHLSELAPDNQFIIATHSPSLVQNGWLGNCLDVSNA